MSAEDTPAVSAPPVPRDVLDGTGRLVASTRDLMLASATSEVPAPDLDRARLLVEQATALLAGRTRAHGVREHLDREAIRRTRTGEPWQVFGHNPLGIPLRITVQGRRANASVLPTALLEGPPRLLHGGFSAAMMDALLSTLVQVQEVRAVTVRLEVSFLQAVPLEGAPLLLAGEIVDITGRKIRAEGTLEVDGVTAVRAAALFIEVLGEPD